MSNRATRTAERVKGGSALHAIGHVAWQMAAQPRLAALDQST